MIDLFVDGSRYVIACLMVIDTYLNIRYLGADEEQKKQLFKRMNVLQFLIHALAYAVIYMKTENLRMIIFYTAQVLFFLIYITVYKCIYKNCSCLLLHQSCLLLSIGFIMLTRLSWERAVRQFGIAVIAAAAAVLVPVLVRKIRYLHRLTWLYAVLGLTLLGVVFLAGSTSFGAQLSIMIGGVAVQPSELVKITFVCFVAAMLEKSTDFKQVFITGVIAVMHVGILVLSKDLGSGAIFFVAGLCMIFAATSNWFYLGTGLAGASGAAFLAYRWFPHVRRRVLAWRDPWSHVDDQGYQIAQSLFAIGSGSWFGMGLYRGMPGKIPVVEKDFVFAAISEELGAVFAICLILIYVCCFVKFVSIARKQQSLFYQLTGLGLGMVFITQVFFCVGGVVKFIPSTGVTLPLVSYGGSSVFCTVLMFGMMQGLYLISQEQDRQESDRVSRRRCEKHRNRWEKTERQFRRITYVIGVFFAVMCAYLVNFLVVHREEVINNTYNARLAKLSDRVQKGCIRSNDGSVLAQTVVQGEAEIRIYPYGSLLDHVAGYAAMGKTGIEALGDFYMLSSHISLSERIFRKLAGGKNPGDDIYTTLDLKLQQSAWDALGDRNGAVVVLEPDTGKILALVSKPGYDPNLLEENWEQLVADVNGAPLVNRGTQGLYPPGSIFKIVTLLQYIREHPDVYEEFRYTCDGVYEADGYTIQCYHQTAHGEQTLAQAFANSCNGAFASLGTSLDIQGLKRCAEELLYDQDLPLSLPYSRSRFELSENAGSWEIAQTVIGQGKTQTTPMHQAIMMSAIANGGILMKPYLIDRVENVHGELVKQFLPESRGSIMTAQESQILLEMLKRVVAEGTGSNVRTESYTAAGKTGSAEFETGKKTHAWFSGFAPAENPKLAVTVLVEEAGSGGNVAAPVARMIFDSYLGSDQNR